jgi:regulator of protease activity HflC (stomatin/prohibitin superfamily)
LTQAVRGMSGRLTVLAALMLIPVLLFLGVCYWWFVQRIEVGPGELLVLVRKVGEPIPAPFGDQVLLYPAMLTELGVPAEDSKVPTRYKGIVYEPLREGRYFFDPFFWECKIVPAIHIGQGEVGIPIRKFGKPLPPGKIVATEPHERGPLAEPLRPGRHNINPFAYEVKLVKAIRIPEGFVGVQTLFAGETPKDPNRYVVDKGERGVQPDVLPPGFYQNNPYVRHIDVIEVRTQTLDLRGAETIHFPSQDSFMIALEGTVQYAVRQDMAPYVLTAFGAHEDIVEKLILPNAKSLARIEGSKLTAREFISGESRSAFQKRVFEGLREQCNAQGIDIEATPIRKVIPPEEIAEPISERQMAEQRILQFENEIKVAQSEARLVEQEEMQGQNKAIGEANRDVVKVIKASQQEKSVAVTQANKRLEVARLALEAARETAQAKLSRGKADAEVILLNAEAEARPLADAVSAFGGGETYAQYFFYQKLGPALKSVLASTDGPFADIFRALSASPRTPDPSGSAPPAAPRDAALPVGPPEARVSGTGDMP